MSWILLPHPFLPWPESAQAHGVTSGTTMAILSRKIFYHLFACIRGAAVFSLVLESAHRKEDGLHLRLIGLWSAKSVLSRGPVPFLSFQRRSSINPWVFLSHVLANSFHSPEALLILSLSCLGPSVQIFIRVVSLRERAGTRRARQLLRIHSLSIRVIVRCLQSGTLIWWGFGYSRRWCRM